MNTEELVGSWLATYPSPRTRETYATSVRQFKESLDGKRLLDAGIQDAARFRDFLRVRGLSPNTINHRLSGLSSLFRHAVEHGAAATNPFREIRRPAARAYGKIQALDPEEAAALLREAPHWPLKERTAIRLMLISGLRSMEVRGARAKDVRRANGNVWLTIHSKGGTSRMIRLDRETGRDVLALSQEGGFLFGSDSPPYRKKVYLWVRRRTGYHPHALRHTSATLARSRLGADIREISAHLGHSDIKTTEVYIASLDRRVHKISQQIADSLAAT